MSTNNYDEEAADVLELLTEFGQTVTRNTRASGSYDPSASSSSVTTGSGSRIGALFDYGAGVEYVRGMQVARTDKQLLLDAEGAVDITDTFTVGGTTYAVQSVGEINPAGTVVLYDLHLRVA